MTEETDNITVFVHYSKEKYSVQTSLSEVGFVFLSQVTSLVNVPPHRLKILGLPTGSVLTAEDVLGEVGITDGIHLYAIGSDQSAAAGKRHVVTEDFAPTTEKPEIKAVGLQNLGNTCYLSATIQALHAVPSLRQAVLRSRATHPTVEHVRTTFRQLSAAENTVFPVELVRHFRSAFPQFNEKGEKGGYLQQDAGEALVTLLGDLSGRLTAETTRAAPSAHPGVLAPVLASSGSDLLRGLMELKLASQMRCVESEAEAVTSSEQRALHLSCHISQQTRLLQLSLQEGLKESITKHSPLLGRDAVYERTSRVCRLPRVLLVQFVRFYWDQRASAHLKISRRVSFPTILDMYDMCDEGLKEQLLTARTSLTDGEAVKEPEDGSHSLGWYDLTAVLTHIGRSANSGHYVSFCKTADDRWAMMDDENVQEVEEADVLSLEGGSGTHTAYWLVYTARDQAP